MRPNQLLPMPQYTGPIFDGDTHIVEKDWSMFETYLPKKYHHDWLIHNKIDADGKFSAWIGQRPVLKSEGNAEGLVPPLVTLIQNAGGRRKAKSAGGDPEYSI